MEKIFLFATNV